MASKKIERLYTKHEAAAKLGVSVAEINEWLRRKKIPVRVLSGDPVADIRSAKVRFTSAQIEKIAEKIETGKLG